MRLQYGYAILLKMSKFLRILLILALILSPLWVGLIASPRYQAENLSPFVVLLATVIGVPIIVIVGITTSIVTRNKSNAKKWSLVGYLIPAVLVCIYEITMLRG